MKPAPLVKAVADYCLVCTKVEACWACVFSNYYDDVVIELVRRRGAKAVNLSDAREELFRFVTSRAGGFPPRMV